MIEHPPTARPIRLVLAHDHALLRAALRHLLESEPDFDVVGVASTICEAITVTRATVPDIVLLDAAIPDRSGVGALPDLTAISGAHVILVTVGLDASECVRAFGLRVDGIVLKEDAPEKLFSAIRMVAGGDEWIWREPTPRHPGRPVILASRGGPSADPSRALTARERDVLAAVVDGCTNRQIAERLGISEETVKHHVTSLFNKTGASTRTEMAVFAVHHRLVDA